MRCRFLPSMMALNSPPFPPPPPLFFLPRPSEDSYSLSLHKRRPPPSPAHTFLPFFGFEGTFCLRQHHTSFFTNRTALLFFFLPPLNVFPSLAYQFAPPPGGYLIPSHDPNSLIMPPVCIALSLPPLAYDWPPVPLLLILSVPFFFTYVFFLAEIDFFHFSQLIR